MRGAKFLEFFSLLGRAGVAAVTLDPLHTTSGANLSGGNLVLTGNTAAPPFGNSFATASQTTGKFYYEVTVNNNASGDNRFGVAIGNTTISSGQPPGNEASSIGITKDGDVVILGVTRATLQTWSAGLTVSVAVDIVNKKIWFRTGNGGWNNDVVANQNPATNTGGISWNGLLTNASFFPVFSTGANGSSYTVNFGASAYLYSVPSGFLNWNGTAAASAISQMLRLEVPNIAFTGAANNTYCYKKEAEAPFNQVRIRVHHNLATTVTGFKAVVAATETALRDTQARMFEPISGGVSNNALATSGNGWRAVTWDGGNATSGTAAAGNTIATYVESDWINVPSIPRADNLGTRPLLLVRVCSPTGSGNSSTFKVGGTQIVSDRNDIDYSRVDEAGQVGGDGVGSLTTEPTNYFFRSPFNGSALVLGISIEYRYVGVQATAILNGGDSLSAGVQASQAQLGAVGGQDGWEQRAIFGVSTPDAPFTFMNTGQSGQTSASFMAATTAVLNSGVRPTYIFLPTGSRNDGYGSNSIADTYFGLVDTMIALCATLIPRPRIIMWNDTPLSGVTGSSANDAVRAYARGLAQARLSAGTIAGIVDCNTAVAQGTPQIWDSTDNLHPSDGNKIPGLPASTLMASTFKSYLRSSFGPTIMRPAGFLPGISFTQVGSNCVIRPSQVSGSNITRTYQWYANGVALIGATSLKSPTWITGDIGKTITCVETVSGAGAPQTSTASFGTVIAAGSNIINFTQTPDFSATAAATGVTLTGGQADPFGGTGATLLTEDTSTSEHKFQMPNFVGHTSGLSYTLSALFKQGSQSYVQMYFDSTRFSANAYCWLDLNAGSGTGISGVGAALTNMKVERCEENPGWLRIQMSAPCTSSGTGVHHFCMENSSTYGTRAATYLGSSKTMTVFGVQLEQAAAANAYVPT